MGQQNLHAGIEEPGESKNKMFIGSLSGEDAAPSRIIGGGMWGGVFGKDE